MEAARVLYQVRDRRVILKEHALRCPYRTHAGARVMGKVEEVQEQMKADMEAMKEQMATMMEATMSMKKIMEANAVAVATTSVVAKVNPMPPSGPHGRQRFGNENVNNSTPILIERRQPQTDHVHVSQTVGETHEIPHHNLAGFEPCLRYATEGQVVGGILLQNTLEGPQYHPQPHLLHSTTGKNPHAMAEMGKLDHLEERLRMVGYAPSSFANLVFAGERIEAGLKRGKFDHPALMNEKTAANKEDEKEGETHVVTVIPIQPSFPPIQQCHYSANNKPSPYPPPSYPQRPSLNQPQSLSTALPMTNTTFSTNQNTNQEMNFAVKKPVEFTPIPVSYADLLPYLLDNSMVAITPAKVHQPPFLREYDSNATCACHGEAPGHSIEHCGALKHKVQSLIDAGRFPTSNVQSFEFGMTGPLDESISCFLIRVDPWVLVLITFRGLCVLAIRGLHALTFRGLHVLTFRGLHALTFRGLHVLTIRGLHALAFRGLRILTFRGLHICALREFKHNQRGSLSHNYYAYRGKISPVPLQRITPTRHPVDLKKSNRASRFPALVMGLCQSYRVPVPPPPQARSCHRDIGIAPARHPVDLEKSNRVLGFSALITGLYQFYGVPVAPSKVIKPPINRAFIKKAQGETPQQPRDGRQRAIDAPLPPPEPLSSSTKAGALPTTHGRPAGDQVQSQR
ncbi:hypothetical protein HKD37_15G043345 [Glycine soja]